MAIATSTSAYYIGEQPLNDVTSYYLFSNYYQLFTLRSIYLSARLLYFPTTDIPSITKFATITYIMSVFLRNRLSLRATPSISARQLAPLRSAYYPLGQRLYAHSSYGGDGETEAQQPNNPRNQPTRDIEHPGMQQ